MSNKKKRKPRARQPRQRTAQDWHHQLHFLYQRRHWQQGYAKALREHWYCGSYIPRDTLHRAIHSKLHDVPTPNGNVCKQVFEKLCRMENNGLISESDSPLKRLDFLIEEFDGACPATTAILQWEREIIEKFYNKPSE